MGFQEPVFLFLELLDFLSRILVHLRRPSKLSTIGLADTQPFDDPAGRYAFSHNGDFERHTDLRAGFRADGRIHGRADTEVGARWLDEAAIKPWTHRSWIFPRDPDFGPKAARVLDLYAGEWDGRPLKDDEFVISADEKTSIQARIRCHPTLPPAAGRALRVEFEYERGGALQYLAAWDVHRARLFGRCEPKTGIEPFGRLVEQVMTAEPYRSARRVFWVLDNGSSHRGKAAVTRLTEAYPRLVPVHLPVHASWLNQVEIYFSILERKVLTPAAAASLEELAARILAFQANYEVPAQPFEWKFTRADLTRLLGRLATPDSGWLSEAA